MTDLPHCPKCDSPYTYEDRGMLVCPECAHEWSASNSEPEGLQVTDAHGNLLQDGRSILIREWWWRNLYMLWGKK